MFNRCKVSLLRKFLDTFSRVDFQRLYDLKIITVQRRGFQAFRQAAYKSVAALQAESLLCAVLSPQKELEAHSSHDV